MSRNLFIKTVQENGVYEAARFAAHLGIPLATVQLWLRSVSVSVSYR